MRVSAGTIANALAIMLVGALIVAALLVAGRLGFAGLFLLGGSAWLVCVRASLDQRVPTWGTEVFRSAARRERTPEERAAARAEHEAALSPLRVYGRCAAVLALVGAGGFAWQVWRGVW